MDIWDDTRIEAGTHWEVEISKALLSARVGVLLVSPNFLGSHFIIEKELPLLLKAVQEGLIIFWVHLKSSLYERTEIIKFQAAHDVRRPLHELNTPQREASWKMICEKLLKIVGTR